MVGFTGNASTVGWGDVDNDGDPDLFVGGTENTRSALFMNYSGRFSDESATYGLPNIGHVRTVQWLDYNQDGLLDLLVLHEPPNLTHRTTPGVRLFRQNANHRFQQVPLNGFDANYYIRSAAWADLNNDGALDLILSNSVEDDGPLTVLEQDGVDFVEQRAGGDFDNLMGVGAICVVDYDNDSDYDIFMGASDDTHAAHLFRNINGRYIDVREQALLPSKLAAEGAVWADFDNNGLMDLFTPGDANHTYLYYEKRADEFGGSLNFVRDVNLAPAAMNSRYAHATDANMDGILDLFIPRTEDPGCSMLIRSNGVWIDMADEVELRNQGRMNMDGAWADIDGDGDVDLAIAQGPLGVRLYRNETSQDHEYIVLKLTGPSTVTSLMNCSVRMRFQSTELIRTTSCATSSAACDFPTLLIANPALEVSPEPHLIVRWSNGQERLYDHTVLVMRTLNVLHQPGPVDPRPDPPTMTSVGQGVQFTNGPNPFNPTTMISFTLPEAGHVRMSVFNLLGQEIALLADEEFVVGRHSLIFDAAALPSGLYFAKLTTLGQTYLNRMLLAK
jgi:hypothetical protein